MKPEDAEEYTQALGQVVAGGWRQIALGQRLGVPQALKLTTDQWVKQRLGGYVRMSLDERKAAAIELKAEGLSQRQIGAVLGVDHVTVGTDLGRGENSPLETSTSTGNGSKTGEDSPLDLLTVLAATNDVRQRIETQAATEERRASRLGQLAAPSLDGLQRFPVIYADPPWRYEHVKTESRAIENQYPTMTLDEIAALPVEKQATDDALLFLWATSPKLAEAMTVIVAWGFTYRTSAVWDKGQIGMGYYFRQQHELLLVAAKGDPPAPPARARQSSVIHARRGAHSEKPIAFYEAIERMYPTLPKLELFARATREGWTTWGNQVTGEVSPDSIATTPMASRANS